MRWVIALLFVYVAGYGVFRSVNMSTDSAEVLYPENNLSLYYLFRPMAYLDQALTGTASHIGPHQEAQT
ncbi:MAG: hypothetical protein AB3N23_17205 [Paracoccaceae bacterium]